MTRLAELDPRWLVRDGRRIGLIFISPVQMTGKRSDGSPNPTIWRQSCFFEATPFEDQMRAVHAAMSDLADEDGEFDKWQPCREIAWKADGDLASASFDALTITPSIDGSAGGLWHGFITNGEIK